MKIKTIAIKGFINSFSAVVYVGFVAWIMTNVSKNPLKDDNFLTPVFFLTLLIISASITGTLILGKPILLYLEGLKKDAVQLFASNLVWLLVFLLILFFVLFSR